MSNSTSEFSIQIARQLSDDETQFPVDFDYAWHWLGYFNKQTAKRSLISWFQEGVDYVSSQSHDETPMAETTQNRDKHFSAKLVDESQMGRPNQKIYLTVDCLEEFGMMAKTEQGTRIRKFFVQVKKEYKKSVLRVRELEAQIKTQEEVKLLTSWKEARRDTKSIHPYFVASYKLKRHPGRHVHDLITTLITGQTANQARVDNQLTDPDEDPTIGLNYQPDPLQLAQIELAKKLYAGYQKGDWREQVHRAVFHACPELGEEVDGDE